MLGPGTWWAPERGWESPRDGRSGTPAEAAAVGTCRPLRYPEVQGERGGADGAPGGEMSGWDEQILRRDVAEVSVLVPSALPGRAGGVSGVERAE